MLVALSLVLITGYFRESEQGGLHDAQGFAATVLRPFEIGAERVARPFQDLYGYFAGLVHAKGEVDRLRRQNSQLRVLVAENQFAAQERDDLRRQLRFQAGPTYPKDFRAVSGEVIAQPPTQFEREVAVSVGSSHGVRDDDPVVTADGLVGKVTMVTPYKSRVTLISDEESGVSARVVRRQASGLLERGHGGSDSLVLNLVSRDKFVDEGDGLVTAGWRLGELTPVYPEGIPIGVISGVGQTDTDTFKRIQVEPYVDFSALRTVIVLIPKNAER